MLRLSLLRSWLWLLLLLFYFDRCITTFLLSDLVLQLLHSFNNYYAGICRSPGDHKNSLPCSRYVWYRFADTMTAATSFTAILLLATVRRYPANADIPTRISICPTAFALFLFLLLMGLHLLLLPVPDGCF